jgi:hypothetical protein
LYEAARRGSPPRMRAYQYASGNAPIKYASAIVKVKAMNMGDLTSSADPKRCIKREKRENIIAREKRKDEREK